MAMRSVLGRARSWYAGPILAGVVAIGAVLVVISCQREHVPSDIQRQLPLLTFFSELCETDLSATDRRNIERQADVLLRELQRRPGELVTIEDTTFADGPEPNDLTVRELAERRLEDFSAYRDLTGHKCAQPLEQRLKIALRG